MRDHLDNGEHFVRVSFGCHLLSFDICAVWHFWAIATQLF